MLLWTVRAEECGQQLDEETQLSSIQSFGNHWIYLLSETTGVGLMNKKRSMLYWSSRGCGHPEELHIRINKNKIENV